MKKILIFILVLITAVALIGPKIVGSQFTSGIENTVAAINKNPNYRASITSIESAWFSTKAEVSVGLNMPDMSAIAGQPPLDFSLTLNVSGHHGPFIIHNGFAIGWLHTLIQTQALELPEGLTLPNNDALYNFDGLTSLFTTTTYQDNIAAMQYVDPETKSIASFSGLKGSGVLSMSGIQYEAVAQSIRMNVENIFDFDVQNLALNIQSSESLAGMLSKGLYDSSVSFSSQLISFKNISENTEVRVVDAVFAGVSDYDEKSDLGDLVMTTTVASIDAPDMNITDINSVIEINNLQAKFLLAYQDFANLMMKNMADPAQTRTDVEVFMNTYLLEQLQAKPEYNFSNISGKINGSEFTGKIMTSLGEVNSLPTSLEDTAFWMQHIIVDSKIVLQKGAANYIATQVVSAQLVANPDFAALSEEEQAQIIQQQVQGTINGLVQQGMMTLEGEDYSLVFTLEKGVAMLNGNQIPI